MMLNIYRIKDNVTKYGFFSCGNAFLNFIITVVLIKYCALGWTGRVYAQTVCAIGFGACFLLYSIKRGWIKRPDWSYWKSMLLWGIPLIPHSATVFIRQGCDRYIIESCHSIEAVGLFSFSLNLCNVILMVGHGFTQVNRLDIYKVLGDKTL